MITNRGNNIIAKYLLGQAPEYAAYIAVGTGARPLGITESDYSSPAKKSMDFEAFRIPVTSRGIVTDTITKPISFISTSGGVSVFTTSQVHGIIVGDEVDVYVENDPAITVTVTEVTSNTFTGATSYPNGNVSTAFASVSYIKNRLVFKGQVPPDHKYQMTEMALYPAANNQLAIGHDSKVITSFSGIGDWYYYGGGEVVYTSSAIDNGSNGNIYYTPNSARIIDIDNITLYSSATRKARYEVPRFLDRSLIVKGNLSTFSDDTLTNATGGSRITNTSVSLDLSKYSSSDVIKVALSVVSELEITSIVPHKTRVRVDLIDADGNRAMIPIVISNTDISASRYYVSSTRIDEVVLLDASFNWSKIVTIDLYASTLNSVGGFDNSYVIFDGIRIDNENITNPLYGMVAYSRIKNSVEGGSPIEKTENSQGYIEYRLGVSIF